MGTPQGAVEEGNAADGPLSTSGLMKPLWAPWRMQFILEKKPKGCIFCFLLRQRKDRDNLIVYRGKKAYVLLNKFPYNNGHLMVVPNRHTSILGRLDKKTLSEMMD